MELHPDQREWNCILCLRALRGALGQKPTYAVQNVMSALPPIATAKADIRKRSCLLYPRKQTCALQLRMSAKGQKRTFKTGTTVHRETLSPRCLTCAGALPIPI